MKKVIIVYVIVTLLMVSIGVFQKYYTKLKPILEVKEKIDNITDDVEALLEEKALLKKYNINDLSHIKDFNMNKIGPPTNAIPSLDKPEFELPSEEDLIPYEILPFKRFENDRGLLKNIFDIDDIRLNKNFNYEIDSGYLTFVLKGNYQNPKLVIETSDEFPFEPTLSFSRINGDINYFLTSNFETPLTDRLNLQFDALINDYDYGAEIRLIKTFQNDDSAFLSAMYSNEKDLQLSFGVDYKY